MSSSAEHLHRLKKRKKKTQTELIVTGINYKLLDYYSLSHYTPLLHTFPSFPGNLYEQAVEVQTTF